MSCLRSIIQTYSLIKGFNTHPLNPAVFPECYFIILSETDTYYQSLNRSFMHPEAEIMNESVTENLINTKSQRKNQSTPRLCDENKGRKRGKSSIKTGTYLYQKKKN